MIISLNAKQKTVKIVEDNTGQNLDNLEYDNDILLSINPRSMFYERNNC